MSNILTNTITLDKDDYVFQSEVDRGYLEWFNALFASAKKELKNGDTRQAQILMDIGQYLTEDIGYYKDIELDDLKKTKH